jgi:hypothetical protein
MKETTLSVDADLIFFGDSRSTSQERSERFEAASMAALMHDHFNVDRYHVVSLSTSFYAYRWFRLTMVSSA